MRKGRQAWPGDANRDQLELQQQTISLGKQMTKKNNLANFLLNSFYCKQIKGEKSTCCYSYKKTIWPHNHPTYSKQCQPYSRGTHMIGNRCVFSFLFFSFIVFCNKKNNFVRLWDPRGQCCWLPFYPYESCGYPLVQSIRAELVGFSMVYLLSSFCVLYLRDTPCCMLTLCWTFVWLDRSCI